MDLPMYEFQIDEVNKLLTGKLSNSERMAAELQLQYLLEERTVVEDFEKCTVIQKDLIKRAIEEEEEEDTVRRACRKPLHDHSSFRRDVTRINEQFSVRCRGAESDGEDEFDGDDVAEMCVSLPGKMTACTLEPREKNDVKGGARKVGHGQLQPLVRKHECVVCFEMKSEVYQFPCGHLHCHDCTAQLFHRAVADRSLIPIRCCKREIDQTICSRVLPGAERKIFEQALEEVRATNKMFCPRRECGAFINLDKVAAGPKAGFTCPSCSLVLCSHCRASHSSLITCAQHAASNSVSVSAADAAFLQLAANKKYARCNKCRSFVELKLGCNHITCVCRYEFCYQCNAQWKTCACRTWEEENLIVAGRERAGAQRGDARVVHRHMRNLLRVEECDNHQWTRQARGGFNCQNCNFFMLVYHYSCTNCTHRVCYTCRFHRL